MSTARRRIAIVTGTRAEYGLLFWIIKGISEDPALQLQLIVTGTHLAGAHGMTVQQIETDGFPISERIDLSLGDDTERGIAQAIGKGVVGFSEAYDRLRPDILLVLGDRYEILAAVSAAVPFRIPIAHIHGGESTSGLIDEQIRHAVTKMSHIHFPATQEYRNRIIQMGEDPQRVFWCGAPGLDSIQRLRFLDRHALNEILGIGDQEHIGVVTYHPVTLERGMAQSQANELIAALRSTPGVFWVFTLPNADTEGSDITKRIEAFVARYPARAKAFPSLGSQRYLSLLRYADVMVGNSSSGIIEAPAFALPVVNIGHRQGGRARNQNVIDVERCERRHIARAIARACSREFRESLADLENVYGDGGASGRIVTVLKQVSLDDALMQKRFYALQAMTQRDVAA